MTPTPTSPPPKAGRRPRAAAKHAAVALPSVALTGLEGAGKDTVATALSETHTPLSFATAMKDEMLAADPVIRCEQAGTCMRLSDMVRLYGSLEAAKRAVPGVRAEMLRVGMARRAEDWDYWARLSVAELPNTVRVWADTRFLNEWEHVADAGPAVLVEVRRAGDQPDDSHSYEVAELCERADYVVTLTTGEPNDAPIAALRKFLADHA
jgi:hypothetical protein